MKISHFIQKYTAIIRFTVFLSSFIVMGYVLADGHLYTYPSDSHKIQKNRPDTDSANKNQHQKTFGSTNNPVHIQYSYPPPTQRPGSNPLTKPDRYPSVAYPGEYTQAYTYPSGTDSYSKDTTQNLSSVNYIYPPSTQKYGSNPFNRSHNRYAGSYPTESSDTDKTTAGNVTYNQNGVIYIYPPLTKQLGSNPFNKSSHQYADSKQDTSKKQISSSDQEQYRYLYHYQSKPRYIESDNGFMSYIDTHLMYP